MPKRALIIPNSLPSVESDKLPDLEKLAELKGKGILNDEEFKLKKSELLKKLGGGDVGTTSTDLDQYVIKCFNELFTPSKRIYVQPNIAPQVLLGAQYINLQSDEQLIAIFDETFTKNAKVGFAFTTRGVYWQNQYEKVRVVDYASLKGPFEIGGGGVLRLGPGLKINIDMTDTYIRDDLVIFMDKVCSAYCDGIPT